MKKYLLTGLIAIGTVVMVVVIFVGGWMVLDNFSITPYSETGTRSLFQEASRVEAMQQPVVYAGSEKCMECHFPSGGEWLHSSHNTVSCEDCHGPGNLHASEGGPIEVSTSSSLCLTCHARIDSKPEGFPQVALQEHSGGLECLVCHDPMHPNIVGAPQMPDFLMKDTDCLACHKSDNLVVMPPNHEARSGEDCTQCHTMEAGK